MLADGMAGSSPNFIFLFADDQRADTIGAHGNKYIQTPNLDKLTDSGFSFRRNYCAGSFSGAVCVSSRAMLMTGRHWKQIPSTNKGRDWTDLPLLPSVLEKKGGYSTFIIGKWHNGEATLKRAFSSGKSVYMGGMANHADFQVQDFNEGKLGPKRPAGGFSSTVFADEAIDFIRDAKVDQPFFLYVAFMAPHDPRNPPELYRKHYYKKPPPLPENFLPVHPFRNAPFISMSRDESLAPWPRTPEVIRDQLSEYYGLITHLDEQVGRIMDALDNSPHADNTIIIYTADHGLALGSHGLLGKQNIYEQSMMCPLIINGPGIPANQSSNAFTYIHDLYPTICILAGLNVDVESGTHSLVPIMEGRAAKVRNSLFLPFQDNQRSINDGKWKLHVYPKINYQLLFNLEKDPHETKNLADIPSFEIQSERMTTLMESWRSLLGDEDPLTVDNPEPKEFVYQNTDRILDVWQPDWIREKYFKGIENATHGSK